MHSTPLRSNGIRAIFQVMLSSVENTVVACIGLNLYWWCRLLQAFSAIVVYY